MHVRAKRCFHWVMVTAALLFAATLPVHAEALAGETRTQLPNGLLLVLGGPAATRAATLYDPVSDRTTPLSSALSFARTGHTATLLPDGRVLILGGHSDAGLVAQAEAFNPRTRQFELVPDVALLVRSGHVATLLSDGQLLIVGGSGARGDAIAIAELWNPRTGAVTVADQGIALARVAAAAQLLPDGTVLVTGGQGASGAAATDALRFLPEHSRFEVIALTDANALVRAAEQSSTLQIVASVPPADDHDFAPDGLVVLRFSQPVDVTTINTDSVTLLGPEGVVSAKVVPSQDGMLAFLTPDQPLLPGTQYTLLMHRAATASGHVLELEALSFTTRILNPLAGRDANAGAAISGSAAADNASMGAGSQSTSSADAQQVQAAALDLDDDNEIFVPTAENHGRRWRTSRPLPKDIDKRIHELLAAKGSLSYEDAFKERRRKGLQRVAATASAFDGTGISGQVLRLNDRPLANAIVSIGAITTRTDAQGHFRLTGVPAGRQELFVDGSRAGSAGKAYAQFVFGVDVIDGQLTEVPPVYLSRVREQDWIPISSPTQRDLVVTHPNIPGMEIRIPKGAVLRERNGNIATKIALIPIPLDRVPFAFPENAPVYVSVQPGGLVVQGLSAKTGGVRVIYPNLSNDKPGTPAHFWRYDPLAKGWYIYGHGHASADGKQIVPDPGVAVYDSIGFMYTTGQDAPPPDGPQCPDGNAPPDNRGDPVSCGTGLFLHTSTDITLNDVLPLSVSHTYRPGDSVSRDFGFGTSHPYAIYLYGAVANDYTTAQLVRPDGGHLDYVRVSPGTGFADAVLEHTSSGSAFYKSRITYVTASGRWVLRLKDGTVYEFNGSGDLVSLRDRFGNSVEITRNGGLIARITSPSGRYLDFTYTNNRITQIVDSIGRTVTYEYYATGDTTPGAKAGYLKKVIWKVGYAGEPDLTEEYTYDTAGRMKTIKDRRGNTMVNNEYDTNGRVFRQTLPDQGLFRFDYTLTSGKVTRTDITNPRGYVERLDFNAAGLITTRTLALGTTIEQKTTYEYQPSTNLLLATVDHRNRRTEYEHDANGNVKLVRRLAGTADAVTEAFEHTTDFNQLKKYTDPRQKDTLLRYEGPGLLREVEDPLGHQTSYEYDDAGQVTSITRGTGANTTVTTYTYDLYDLRTVTAGGFTTTYTTDAIGRVAAVTDGRGNVTYNEYDALSRLRQVIDAQGGVTELSYDGNGNLTRVKDPGDTATQYGYDLRNRMETRTDPFGKSETLHWDGNGNLDDYTDRRGNRTDYTYDELDRRKRADYADKTSTATDYTFVGVEAEVVVTEPPRVITQRFDGLDRLRYEVTPQGRIDYGYDAASRRRSLQVEGQTALAYDWDDANRLLSITRNGQAIGFDHDEADRRKAITFPNGVKQQMNYARAWTRPTGIDYYNGATLLEGQTDASFDADGRPELRTGTGTLPRTGLPNAGGATYDRNRLTARNGSTWSYDDQGNLTGDGTFVYQWDVRNRLVAITQGAATVASFGYDAFNRRAIKTVSGTTTTYLHDGLTPVQEQVAGSSTQLISGLKIDDYLARIEPTKTRYYLTDFLGSTVALANEAGSIATRYTYEPFGETSLSGEASANRFQYTGRENDGTGLYYYRARYFHPVAKRFISEDPIGTAGGLNVYSYVGGNPLSFVDPEGLMGFGGGGAGGTPRHVTPARPLPSIYDSIRAFDEAGQRWWRDMNRPMTDTRYCATAECAAGLRPAPWENRTDEEIQKGQCKLTCQMAASPAIAACNIAFGGGFWGAVGGQITKQGLCELICQ